MRAQAGQGVSLPFLREASSGVKPGAWSRRRPLSYSAKRELGVVRDWERKG